MSLNFTNKIFNIGGEGTPTLQFYGRGFNLGIGEIPSWQDIILSGNTALTLVNAIADGLNYVKLYGATEQSNLPNGYTQLKYVQNTANTTNVNTNVMPEVGDELEIRFITPYTASTSNYLLQSRENANAGIFGISGSQTGKTIILSWGTGNSITSNITREYNHVFIVKASVIGTTLTLYVKDVTAGTEDTVTGTITTPSDATTPYFVWGNTAQYLSQITPVYYAKITNNGTTKLNYVAAKDSNNSASFYDLVNDTFITTFDGTITGSTDVATPTPEMPMDIKSNNGVLKVSGNILNRDDLEGNYLLTDEGQRGSSNDKWILTNFIKVKPNTSYIFDFISSGDYIYRRVCGYSSNDYNSFTELLVKKQRPTTEDERYSLSFTTSATTNYIKVSTCKADTNIQITEGTEVIPYRAYGEVYADGVTEGGWQVPEQTNLTADDALYMVTTSGNNKYVAINQDGDASTSADGITWSETAETALVTNSTWTSITYGNNKFVAAGVDASMGLPIIQVSTSTDGTTWTTPITINPTFIEVTSVALTYTGQEFVILGALVDMETQTANWAISTSTDGITWTTPALTSLTADISSNGIAWNGLVYGDGKYIAIGRTQNGVNATTNISTSTDGITWTTPQIILDGGSNYLCRLVYDNDNFILLFSDNINFYSMTSTDGTTWTEPAIETNFGDVGSFGDISEVSFQTSNNTNFVLPLLSYDNYWYITTYKPSSNLTETVTDSLGNTATAEMLLAIDNFKDIQSVLNGNITRNIGIKVFDGTENWSRTDARVSLVLGDNSADESFEPFCTHYKGYPASMALGSLPENGCKFSNATNNPILIKDSVHNTDINTWKAYLADQYTNGTPVILVYPTITSATETVTGQILTTQEGTNTITATGYLDNLELEVSYKGTV